MTTNSQISSNGAATMDNSGTLFPSGSGRMTTNAGTDTIITSTDAIIKESGGLTGSSATSLHQVDLNHQGSMEIRSGELQLAGDHIFSAPISIEDGAITEVVPVVGVLGLAANLTVVPPLVAPSAFHAPTCGLYAGVVDRTRFSLRPDTRFRCSEYRRGNSATVRARLRPERR